MAKLYVAYGSNLNKEQMKDRCPGAEFVGTGTLQIPSVCLNKIFPASLSFQ